MKHKNLVYWGENYNWGDWLNVKLFSLMSGVPEDDINRVWLGTDEPTERYYCIGSILNHTYSEGYEVWGSGMESPKYPIPTKPKKVHAVRGPLTRKALIDNGYECPEVYGDPALLYPRFYKPNVEKKYKYGIIPHFSHGGNTWLANFNDNPDVKVIDVIDPTINRFVDEVNECEIILTSSLHGLICADSYGIPSYWVDLRENLNDNINWFKFKDYFMSVGRPPVGPYQITKSTNLDEHYYYKYTIDIDLDKLYEACPFKK